MCIAAARNTLNMCFSSQHGITDAESLHNRCAMFKFVLRYLEKKKELFAKAGILWNVFCREGFMKSITSSDGESFAMIIEDPIPLEHGKGAWPCFEGGCTFFSLVATASCQIRVYPSHEAGVPAANLIVVRQPSTR